MESSSRLFTLLKHTRSVSYSFAEAPLEARRLKRNSNVSAVGRSACEVVWLVRDPGVTGFGFGV